mmetsp:Transcript_14084/g.30578  ORF Transcript_14084/g.30578 Transcript_14084/m.30578 type:complete len:213 (+) Transcript_14084:1480-2118(+)
MLLLREFGSSGRTTRKRIGSVGWGTTRVENTGLEDRLHEICADWMCVVKLRDLHLQRSLRSALDDDIDAVGRHVQSQGIPSSHQGKEQCSHICDQAQHIFRCGPSSFVGHVLVGTLGAAQAAWSCLHESQTVQRIFGLPVDFLAESRIDLEVLACQPVLARRLVTGALFIRRSAEEGHLSCMLHSHASFSPGYGCVDTIENGNEQGQTNDDC